MEKSDWKTRWDQRGQAVKKVLGESIPQGEVVPFSWDRPVLPGACGLAFERQFQQASYLYMTLGLSQPLEPMTRENPWEFAVRTRSQAPWAYDLLYDLLTHWLSTDGDVAKGYFLPLVFFEDRAGTIRCGLTDDTSELNVVGSMRGLYFWNDLEHITFPDSGGFHLLTATAITEDEDDLAQESTPPHLLLLLQRMGIGQTCDPHRTSVLSQQNAESVWSQIKPMAHDDVVDELDSK